MSNGKFEMHLVVPVKLVGSIVELLEGEGVVISMNPHQEKPVKHTKHVFVGGVKNKGIKGVDLVLQTIRLSPQQRVSPAELQKIFKEKGFAGSSSHSSSSKLLKEGKIYKQPDGCFTLNTRVVAVK